MVTAEETDLSGCVTDTVLYAIYSSRKPLMIFFLECNYASSSATVAQGPPSASPHNKHSAGCRDKSWPWWLLICPHRVHFTRLGDTYLDGVKGTTLRPRDTNQEEDKLINLPLFSLG